MGKGVGSLFRTLACGVFIALSTEKDSRPPRWHKIVDENLLSGVHLPVSFLEYVVSRAAATLPVFVIVMARLSGLFAAVALLLRHWVPMRISIIAIPATAVIITPAIMPIVSTESIDSDFLCVFAGIQGSQISSNGLLYVAVLMMSEFAIGLCFGLGMLMLISAMQLAGELIDRLSGSGIGGGTETDGTPAARLLVLVGIAVLLSMRPLNGHLMFVSALCETFRDVPVGAFAISMVTPELLDGLVRQSLLVSVRVAAPAIVVTSLITIAMGLPGRLAQHAGLFSFSWPLRIAANLILLSCILSGTFEDFAKEVPEVLKRIHNGLL